GLSTGLADRPIAGPGLCQDFRMSDKALLDWPAETDDPVPPASWGRRSPAAPLLPWVFAGLVVALVAGRALLAPYLTAPALQTWSTIFVAICVQALPFLV